MKDILKKYWWVGVIIIFVVPIVLIQIVGNNTRLTFLGNYWGSCISALVTLFVLSRTLRQNHEENENNRQKNAAENQSNREHSSNLRLQEIELKWFEDLKLVCVKLYSAFNNDNVIIASDLDPLDESFNERVTQLLIRMNEAYFNFQLVVNYHKNIVNTAEARKIQHFVQEYLSLLSDMNSLFIYGSMLKDNLNNIDLSPKEIDIKLKSFICKSKSKMEIPEITDKRVWDLLIDNKFDKIVYMREVLNILRTRIDNFNMLKVGASITEFINAEYKKAKEIISNGTEQTK